MEHPAETDRYCEELKGIWHEPVDDNLPLTHAGYEEAYNYMKEMIEHEGADPPPKDLMIGKTLEEFVPKCPWRAEGSYSQRMRDVAWAYETVYDNVVAELGGS